jgi:hypothetical protein
MFSINPFAELSSSISPSIMQTYVIVMVALVVGGTLFDIVHKKSATYFFNNWRKSKEIGTQDVGAGEIVSIAVKTAVIDVATSGEFCNMKRRIAHLLTMYGFIAYVAATVCMVFSYATPGAATPAILPQVWNIGGLMVCLGGYWFWFFIRVDVVAEGNSPFRFVRADLFVVSLTLSVTFGLIWAYVQTKGYSCKDIMLGLYLLTTTVLFVSIPWSKFSHMFFKPAAAMEKRMSEANGSRSNLPAPADKPATLGDPRRQTNNF